MSLLTDLSGSLNLDVSGFVAAADSAESVWTSVADSIIESGKQLVELLGSTFQEMAGAAAEALQYAGEQAGNAAPEFDNLKGATEEAAAGLEHVGGAAGGESGKFGELKESVAESTEGFKQLIEQLGLALGTFEILKESIEAFSAVQDLTTSFTLLSGSATVASGAIEDLIKESDALAVSTKSVLDLAGKMAPTLGVGSKIMSDALKAAADDAAGAHREFENVASAIERVAITGQVSARQLFALGISMQDIANTIGVTVEEAQGLMKKGALDATQDVQILIDTIEKKFPDAAALIKENLSGQFQGLKNQMHEIGESIGESLAPLAKSLMTIASSDIIPFIKQVVDEFAALPEPVKETTLAVAAFAAVFQFTGLAGVITKVTTALSAFALTIGAEMLPALASAAGAIATLSFEGVVAGLISAAAAVSGFVDVLATLSFSELVAGLGAFSFSVEGVAAAFSTAATAALPAFTIALGALTIAVGIAAAAFLGWKLGPWLYDNSAAFKKFDDAIGDFVAKVPGVMALFNSFSGAGKEVADAQATAKAAVDKLAASLAAQGIIVKQGTMNLTEYLAALKKVVVQKVAGGVGDAPGTGNIGDIVASSGDTLAGAGLTQDQYKNKLLAAAEAKKVNEQATKDMEKADSDYATFLKATFEPSILSVADAEKNVHDAYKAWTDAEVGLQNIRQKIASTSASDTKTLTALEADFATAQEAVKSAQQGYTEALKDQSLSKSTAANITKDLQSAEAAVANALKADWTPAVLDHATAMANLSRAQNDQVVAIQGVQYAEMELQKAYDTEGATEADIKVAKDNLVEAQKRLTESTQGVTNAKREEHDSDQLLKSVQKELDAGYQQILASQRSLYPATTNVTKATTDYDEALANAKVALEAVVTAEDALDKLRASGTKDTVALKTAEDNATTARKNAINSNKDLSAATQVLTSDLKASKETLDLLKLHTDDWSQSQKDAEVSLSNLGIQSVAVLDSIATKAEQDYKRIADSQGTNDHIALQAHIKALSDRVAADAAAGLDQASAEALTLTKLKQQETDYQNDVVQRWSRMYDTINTSIRSFSDTAIDILITGKGSFGDAALKMLEDIGKATLNAFIKPATDAIASFLAGAVTNLAKGLGDIFSQILGFGGSGVWDEIFKGASSAGSAAGSAPAVAATTANTTALGANTGALGALTTAISDAGISSAAGGAGGGGGGGGGLSGGLTGWISAVSDVVTAISSVIQNFQLATIRDHLFHILNDTDRMDLVIEKQGSDSIFGYSKATWQRLEDLNPIRRALDSINAAVLNISAYVLTIIDRIGNASVQQVTPPPPTDLSPVVVAIQGLNATLLAIQTTLGSTEFDLDTQTNLMIPRLDNIYKALTGGNIVIPQANVTVATSQQIDYTIFLNQLLKIANELVSVIHTDLQALLNSINTLGSPVTVHAAAINTSDSSGAIANSGDSASIDSLETVIQATSNSMLDVLHSTLAALEALNTSAKEANINLTAIAAAMSSLQNSSNSLLNVLDVSFQKVISILESLSSTSSVSVKVQQIDYSVYWNQLLNASSMLLNITDAGLQKVSSTLSAIQSSIASLSVDLNSLINAVSGSVKVQQFDYSVYWNQLLSITATSRSAIHSDLDVLAKELNMLDASFNTSSELISSVMNNLLAAFEDLVKIANETNSDIKTVTTAVAAWQSSSTVLQSTIAGGFDKVSSMLGAMQTATVLIAAEINALENAIASSIKIQQIDYSVYWNQLLNLTDVLNSTVSNGFAGLLDSVTVLTATSQITATTLSSSMTNLIASVNAALPALQNSSTMLQGVLNVGFDKVSNLLGVFIQNSTALLATDLRAIASNTAPLQSYAALMDINLKGMLAALMPLQGLAASQIAIDYKMLAVNETSLQSLQQLQKLVELKSQPITLVVDGHQLSAVLISQFERNVPVS